MISYKQIASIKIAQKEAGIADDAYRALLFEVAGVKSCKELDSGQVVDVLEAIREPGQRPDETSAFPGKAGRDARAPGRKGWQLKQINTWRKYVRYCKMTELEAAQLLHQITGVSDVESGRLKQTDFDVAMGAVESTLEADETSALPVGIEINYWRDRLPKRGKVNSREIHLIREEWDTLIGLLSPENRNEDYLLGIIAHTCRYAQYKPVADMSSRDALKAIEALKMRIRQCQAKMDQEVPF